LRKAQEPFTVGVRGCKPSPWHAGRAGSDLRGDVLGAEREHEKRFRGPCRHLRKSELRKEENYMKAILLTAIDCSAAVLATAGHSQTSQATDYHYTLPLDLALEASTEAVRACAQRGYHVSATVVDMDGVPQVALRGDGSPGCGRGS